MEENYLITIKGTMEQRGDTDTVELMTRGSLVCLLYTSPSPRDCS